MSNDTILRSGANIVAGFTIVKLDHDSVYQPGNVYVARVDTAGPQDLCPGTLAEDAVWVLNFAASGSTNWTSATYWKQGVRMFRRARTINATWPSILTGTGILAFTDVDGEGNFYWIRHQGTYDVTTETFTRDVLNLQRTTTSNTHSTANIDMDSFAPSAPVGFPNYLGCGIARCVAQESGLVATVNYVFKESGGGSNKKQVGCLVFIDTALAASAAIVVSPDSIFSSFCAPLDVGVISSRVDSAGAATTSARVDGTGTVTGTTSLFAPGGSFDVGGNYWCLVSGQVKKLSTTLSDITPAWLTSIVNVGGFAITASAHRIALHEDVPGASVNGDIHAYYRVYKVSDGVERLEWNAQLYVDGLGFLVSETSIAFAVTGALTTFPFAGWKMTLDNRWAVRWTAASQNVQGKIRPLMRLAPDSIICTRPMAATEEASDSIDSEVYTRGNYAHFDYSGWTL